MKLPMPTATSIAPRTAGSVAIVALALVLGGCSFIGGLFGGGDKPPPPKEVAMKAPPEAKLQVTILASPLINPDLDGRPSPVVVRLYQLGSADGFKNADFARLYEDDSKALGKALLGSTETFVEPGGIKVLSSPKVNPDTTFIGVVVGFRDFGDAKWRAVFPLKGDKKIDLVCSITRLAVELKPNDE